MAYFIFLCNNVNDEREMLLINKNKIAHLHSFYELQCTNFTIQCTRSQLFYFLKEISLWNNLRWLLYQQYIKNTIIVNIIAYQHDSIDYKWNFITSSTIWRKVETDNILSWLSTLGGGYSALGDHFTHCAHTAAKISLKQLELGHRLGDPYLQARCKLFYSISLIQTGKFRQAKKLVREQYKFAITKNNIDSRLHKMCEGIWLKLQYCYKLKMQQKMSY